MQNTGLTTVSGIAKPGYRAFQALNDAGDSIVNAITVKENGASLNVSSPFAMFATLDNIDNTSAARSSLKVFLSLWGNPAAAKDPTLVTANRTVSISVRTDLDDDSDETEPVAAAVAWVTRIDATHCAPRKRWESMGAPARPTTSQLAELKASSRVAREQVQMDDGGDVTLQLSANSALLLEFE
jgi:hypothetical protein